MHDLNLIKEVRYAVSFKVRYADDLKNFHEAIISSTVDVAKTPDDRI